jgi:hypothetical protein
MEEPQHLERDDAASAAMGRADLAAQLQHLEAFATRAVSAGEELPPQLVEMIARLREIVQALDGLAASMADEPSAPDGNETDSRATDSDPSA